MLVAVVLLGWAIVYYRELIQAHFADPDTPLGLFDQLCRLHRINREERKLLREIAERCRPAVPALVFMDAQLLTAFAQAGPSRAMECAALEQKLFGAASGLSTDTAAR